MSILKETRDEFNKNIEEIKSMYEENPQMVNKEVRTLKQNLRFKTKFSKYPILKDIDIDKLLTITFTILIALCGLININLESIGLYYFGIIFFLVGYFIGLNIKGFGLIFLASHGLTGIGFMFYSVLNNVITSPIMTDNSTNLYIYLSIAIILLIVATLLTIVHNLSDYYKKINHSSVYPIAIYFIAFLMIQLFPHITTWLYNLHI